MTKRSITQFFVLTLALFTPFWLLGAMNGRELLPGLPMSALATFCPMISALILVYRDSKGAGVLVLLKRAFDFKRIRVKRWYAAILLIMPLAALLPFVVIRLEGVPIPIPNVAIIPTLVLFAVFFRCSFR